MRVGLRLRAESAWVQLNLFTQRGFQEHIPPAMTLSLKSFFLLMCWGSRTLSGVKPPPPTANKATLKAFSPSGWESLWSQPSPEKLQSGVRSQGRGLGTECANHSISRCQRGFPASLFVATGSPSEETCTAATRGLCHSHIQKRPLKDTSSTSVHKPREFHTSALP